LSTRWGFATQRNLALKSIKPPNSFDQLLLARAYNVDHWVLPALSALCKRTKPTSLKEARQLSIEDIVLIATVREEIRVGPFFDMAGIERRIEAAQLRLVDVASDDLSSVFPESKVAEKESPKEAVTCTGAKADSYNGTEEVAVAITSKAADIQGSDEHPVSPCLARLVNGRKSLTRL
jgi:hypothetical protein